MTRTALRALFTLKAAVGVAAVALLGGGAALASPGDLSDAPPEVELSELEEGSAGQQGLDIAAEAIDRDEALPEGAPERPAVIEELELDVAVPERAEADEPGGEGWALGRADDDQERRLEEFCEAREAEAEAAGAEEGTGIPPFCTAGEDGIPVAPGQYGRDIAEQARDGARPEGAGPPPWAGRDGGDADDGAEVAPADAGRPEHAGPPEGLPPGPPAHANAGGWGNG